MLGGAPVLGGAPPVPPPVLGGAPVVGGLGCGAGCGAPPPPGTDCPGTLPGAPPGTCDPPPGAVVAGGFGALLQSWMTKPLAQFVFAFERFWKSMMKLLSACCWPCEASRLRIVSCTWASVCCLAGVTFVTLKT